MPRREVDFGQTAGMRGAACLLQQSSEAAAQTGSGQATACPAAPPPEAHSHSSILAVSLSGLIGFDM